MEEWMEWMYWMVRRGMEMWVVGGGLGMCHLLPSRARLSGVRGKSVNLVHLFVT